MKKVLKNNFGFSLIEILVTVSILGIIGALTTTILSTTFRSNNKSALIGNIKQSGQAALTFIDQTIRNSDTVICPNVTMQDSKITLLTKVKVKTGDEDKQQVIRFKYFPPDNNNNGFLQQDFPVVDVNQKDTTSVCNVINGSADISPVAITDRNTSTGVSVTAANPNGTIFTVTKNSGFKDLVSVQFNLGPAVLAPQSFDNLLGGTGTVHFETTAQLR